MKASRPPNIPLGDLEEILGDIVSLMGRMRSGSKPGGSNLSSVTPANAGLDLRIAQCHAAITACRRYHFSPLLLRALSAKVLEVETDALVLQRMLRGRVGDDTRAPSRAADQPSPPPDEEGPQHRRPRRRRGRGASR